MAIKTARHIKRISEQEFHEIDYQIYELKTVSKLSPEHDKQALQYLFLLGLQHGKVINFRPASVEKRFVSTTLLPEDRYDLVFNDKQWLALDEDSTWLKALIVELVMDWGAYLETSLFISFETIPNQTR
ncbi:hypothetical protein L0337_44105 [candidate division KSB1 bacterium]|nr:hypothetical protein [candidate division KSB1 bacterium]